MPFNFPQTYSAPADETAHGQLDNIIAEEDYRQSPNEYTISSAMGVTSLDEDIMSAVMAVSGVGGKKVDLNKVRKWLQRVAVKKDTRDRMARRLAEIRSRGSRQSHIPGQSSRSHRTTWDWDEEFRYAKSRGGQQLY